MTRTTSADNLIERFDGGEEVVDYFDFEHATRPNRETRKVNVDMPTWMIDALDEEAGRLSINRQAVIKVWLAERIDAQKTRDAER